MIVLYIALGIILAPILAFVCFWSLVLAAGLAFHVCGAIWRAIK